MSDLAGDSVFILDNGSGMLKAGWATSDAPKVMPNCVMKPKTSRRTFVSGEIEQCTDFSGLYYGIPSQKGFIVNWELQEKVWDYLFGPNGLEVNCAQTRLLMTEPLFNFASIRANVQEIMFEEFGFQAFYRASAPYFSALLHRKGNPSAAIAQIVIDSSYSSTYVVPFVHGKRQDYHIQRIDIGGKMLTNYLKDILSYRQVNLMEETYVVNEMKEKACYVSLDVKEDVQVARRRGADNTVQRDYVLPDYTTILQGFLKDPNAPRATAPDTSHMSSQEQIVKLNNERFSVPELLFHPSDIGVKQAGIPEVAWDVIKSLEPVEVQPHAYRSVLLAGGNAMFPGYQQRVQKELRAFAPSEVTVSCSLPENPLTHAWYGQQAFVNDGHYDSLAVTKAMYSEKGHLAFSKLSE